MNESQELLSNVVTYNKYARYRSDLKRRETWDEIIDRYIGMLLKKYCDEKVVEGWKNKSVDVSDDPLAKEIIEKSQYIYDKRVLPSMRALQFAGPAIEKTESRVYNCAFLPMDHYAGFSELMFLLLGGTGVGYSVQKQHVKQLPEIIKPVKEKKFLIGDSIEGWSDAVKALMKAYFGVTKTKPRFDYSDIRKKGAKLITAGGKAPGPEPLRIALTKIDSILSQKEDHSKLKPIEVHDICCHIADAVLAGGIRRAALISLFSFNDREMATCKYGNWWELNPQRGRANNSAVIVRNRIKRKEFEDFWKVIKDSGSGEPGISLTNDPNYGFNPCFTGDTLVAVADGRNAVPIKQLADEGFTGPIYTIDKGQVTVGHCSKVWKTRKNSQLVKVTLDDGSSIRCTPDHRFMLRNGNYVAAKDLKPDVSLMPFNSFKRSDRDYRMISSNVGRDFAQYRHVAQYYDLTKEGYEPLHYHHIDGDGFNDGIENLEARLGSKNPNHSGISSERIMEILVDKTIEKGGILTGREVLDYSGLSSFSKGRLNELDCASPSNLAEKVYANINHKVVNVEFLVEKEDVYDLTVDGTHNFAVISSTSDDRGITSSGVFVHNCHEISLRPFTFCVAGDTKLITQNGIAQIDEVVGEEVEIWNGQEWSKVKPYQTGDADRLHRVHFSDGSYLDATDDHKFLIKNRFEKDFREVTTLELQNEIRTSKYALQIPRAEMKYEGGYSEPYAYEFGYVLGDGCIVNNQIYSDLYGNSNLIELEGSKHKPQLNYNGTQYTRISFNKQLDVGFTKRLKYDGGLPKELFTWSRESILNFIAGWADADGSQASKGIRIYGREDKIRDGQLLLTKCKINSSVNLMQPEGVETNLRVRKNAVWYLQITKTIDIPCQRLSCDNEEDARFKGKYQIVKRIDTLDGLHKSYCLTEDKLHQCVFNNVLTKQCNLTEINAGKAKDQDDLERCAEIASFFGTLQAGFTDFHYLRSIWKENSENDSLIGVGQTGICNGNVLPLDLESATEKVMQENERVAGMIGINPAARTTTIKPSGTTSCVVGTSSGIHAWHSDYYIRNMQCTVGDDLYNYFTENHPELIKEMDYMPGSAVIGIPMKAPSSAIKREDEDALEFLERVKRFNTEWVHTGHRSGPNYNNVSATVSIKEDEWDSVGHWMWINRNNYSGISVLPYDGGTYADAPFQECSEYEYRKRMKYIKDNPIDLTKIVEDEDNTDLKGELACAAGACELNY